jgi:hypothetical protein
MFWSRSWGTYKPQKLVEMDLGLGVEPGRLVPNRRLVWCYGLALASTIPYLKSDR